MYIRFRALSGEHEWTWFDTKFRIRSLGYTILASFSYIQRECGILIIISATIWIVSLLVKFVCNHFRFAVWRESCSEYSGVYFSKKLKGYISGKLRKTTFLTWYFYLFKYLFTIITLNCNPDLCFSAIFSLSPHFKYNWKNLLHNLLII
jgi:hypothetical protein